jgi:hypothetical protein
MFSDSYIIYSEFRTYHTKPLPRDLQSTPLSNHLPTLLHHHPPLTCMLPIHCLWIHPQCTVYAHLLFLVKNFPGLSPSRISPKNGCGCIEWISNSMTSGGWLNCEASYEFPPPPPPPGPLLHSIHFLWSSIDSFPKPF